MKRRHFLGAAGAYAAIARDAVRGQTGGASSQRARIDLNGDWNQSILGVLARTVQTPSSNRPIGSYDLSREFALPRLAPGEHAMLHFDGIAYFARVFCNGAELGVMSPYVPYEFDISGTARERSNVVRVHIADLKTEAESGGDDEIALGVNPGWEAYGGIIRDAWIELRPATFIENARIAYTLEPDFRLARCSLRAYLQSRHPASGKLEAKLRRGGHVFGKGTRAFSVAAGGGEVDIPFEVPGPALWSPETPDLYDATVSIQTPSGSDEFRFRTGFREFRVKGTTFELNGKPVILNGVCRHDMWKDQGFTLTRQQMSYDMRAIKAMGANFVRLVHYPHHRHIVELADELGLLVSEEPGYWQVDFRKIPRSEIDLGLKILDKTIRRDWNSPSVVAWLLANECHLTAEYLREGKAMCRKTDPIGRLVSAANSMNKEDAKPLFEQAGMDFFDDHPYTFDVSEFQRIAAFYGDSRPLTFTEWGGKEIGQSRYVMPKTVDALLALQKSDQLAGTCFWSWQDLPQFSRIDQEMQNGILESGVVTESREPRPRIVMELRRLYEGREETSLPPSVSPELVPLRHTPWTPGNAVRGIDLTSVVRGAPQMDAWNDFEHSVAGYWSKADYGRNQWQRTGSEFLLWRDTAIDILGVQFLVPSVEGYARPVVVTAAQLEVTIAVGRRCSRLHVLGHITCPGGYPPSGKAGAVAGNLRVAYRDRSVQVFPLRHGYEVARGNMIYQTTRIDPIATRAQRAIRFLKDTAREDYQILLYSADLRGQFVESATWRLEPGEQPILIFAIGTEDVPL